MSTQEYICPRKHVTTRFLSIANSPGPKYIKCLHHKSMTHSPGCANFHQCNLRATRREVY